MSLVLFKINNLTVQNTLSNSVLQACFSASIDIPRFCYHEGLQIAGNCRMCLVEISSSKKLVASCATPLVKGLDIKTTTLRVKRARQAVLEFLLINHPLDCPICDQGGECDLQDITLVFGGDRGRFFEISKRSVFDKNLGPLIKTIMNRCIHCTRCVRFFIEINKLNFVQKHTSLLGLFGRGSKTEVGTYVPQIFLNEFSGNVIDLCPVGALTSKPFSFKARAWELSSVFTYDIFDNMLPRIRLDVSGTNILRVLPYSNINNFSWISNKTRFYFDFLENQNKYKNAVLNLSWQKPRLFKLKITFKDSLKILCNFFLYNLNTSINLILGSVLSIETFFIFKEFFLLKGLNKIYLDNFFLEKNLIMDVKNIQYDFRETFSLNFNKKILYSNLWLLLNIGLNLRVEAPLLFLKILKLKKLQQIKLISFNSINYNNRKKDQNQVNISSKLFLQFLEGRLNQTRYFFKYFGFYKCLVLLPTNVAKILGVAYNLIDVFKTTVLKTYSKKIHLIRNNSNFFLTGIVQKNTSNLTLSEVGIPYNNISLLNTNVKQQLVMAYDTSASIFNKLLTQFQEKNVKTNTILFSMNSYDSSLTTKINLIIPVANLYEIKETFFNLFLEKKISNQINTSTVYDIYTVFQALNSFLFLKYNTKLRSFYNFFYFSSFFEQFKKLRDQQNFKQILCLFNMPVSFYYIKSNKFQISLFSFIYLQLTLINATLKNIKYNINGNINLITTNKLNFYSDIQSDIFISSKTILKSSVTFKKTYNFNSFSLSI